MGEMGHNLVSARELAKSGLEDRMTVRAAERFTSSAVGGEALDLRRSNGFVLKSLAAGAGLIVIHGYHTATVGSEGM